MSSEDKPVPRAPVWPHGYAESFKRVDEWKQHRDGPDHYTCQNPTNRLHQRLGDEPCRGQGHPTHHPGALHREPS